MKKPASISLDLDNLWAYMRVHGMSDWESFPTYFPVVVPHILEMTARLGIRLTIFVVGRDAEIPENQQWLKKLVDAGHDVGNHSYMHEPWMHRYSVEQIAREIDLAEVAIAAATGIKTRAFRGPGFSISRDLLTELCRRGYQYDASTYPTFIGPVARAAYNRSTELTPAERAEKGSQFGKLSDGFKRLRPYRWEVDGQQMIEVPVTTMPICRMPIHFTYLHFLAQVSPRLARLYFRTALLACRATGVAPSMLLHPLDFLATDEVPELARFPGMGQRGAEKRELTQTWLRDFQASFEVLSLSEFADGLDKLGPLKTMAIA